MADFNAMLAAALLDRRIDGGGLVTVGGDLADGLQLKVEAASNAEAIAGASTTKAVTPKAMKAAIDTSRDLIRAEILASFIPLSRDGTAIGGETTIEAPAVVPADTPKLATVYLDGVRQRAGRDYTADGSTILQLTFPLLPEQVWEVEMFNRSLGE